eukprot:2333857-Pyramimonas_sp.AAC.1
MPTRVLVAVKIYLAQVATIRGSMQVGRNNSRASRPRTHTSLQTQLKVSRCISSRCEKVLTNHASIGYSDHVCQQPVPVSGPPGIYLMQSELSHRVELRLASHSVVHNIALKSYVRHAILIRIAG